MSSIPGCAFASHGPETYYFPFSKIRNDPYPTTPDSNKWFPIGWHLFVHDVYGGYGGGSNDPATAESDWANGYLYYLYQRNNWWVNCIILDPIDNRNPWGCTTWRGSGQWTQNAWYTRFLDAAETLKNNTSGLYDIKVFPYLISKLPGSASDINYSLYPTPTPTPVLYQLHSSGTWSTIPNDDENTFRGRIQSLMNKSQLGGWILSNEPYGGDDARTVGRRSAIHDQLEYIRYIISEEDTNLDSHPIWCNIRGNGNYNFDPCAHPEWLYLLDDLSYGDDYHSIVDFMVDNLYTTVYAPDNQTADFSKYLPNVQGAVKNLLSPTCGAPVRSQGPTYGYLLKSQGGREDVDYTHGYIPLEKLRYVNYAPWINGAQGCIFYTLSKSGYDPYGGQYGQYYAFNNASQISEEAYYLSKYLLQPDAGINATISSSPVPDTYVQFILKDDPDFVPSSPITRRVMLMVCNNSLIDTNVTVDFPQSMTIYNVDSFFSAYLWSHVDTAHSVSIGLGGQTARAFTVEFE